VILDNDVVISGYLDGLARNISSNQISIEVSGRSKAGDLVDCSVETVEFNTQDFVKIIERIASPFGIKIINQTKVKPVKLPKKSFKSGDTCVSAISKLAKMHGVMIISDGGGNLIITQSGLGGKAFDSLVMGKNIKEASINDDYTQVFSKITVKSQTNSTGGVGKFESLSAANLSVTPKGTAQKSASASVVNGLNRYRPLIIIADEQSNAKQCQERAEFEVGSREAKARKMTVKVVGWRQRDGRLWEINTLVNVDIPQFNVKSELLIAKIDFELGKSGEITTFELLDKKAFNVLKEIPKKQSGSKPANITKLSAA
jgi:prophage tail gpP-like protein